MVVAIVLVVEVIVVGGGCGSDGRCRCLRCRLDRCGGVFAWLL